tara:strand:+ start:244 stop:1380 length:1137 start_codon:yes stop_codon:yes gene_type:complete
MGKLRKIGKKIGRGIKKIGKKIGKAFKKVLKPFAKVFNKLGPIGTIAMSMFLPGIGSALAGWGASMGNVVGTMIKFVGNAINYVSTAPKKIFGTITDALGASWDTLTGGGVSGGWKPGSWFDNFQGRMTDRIKSDGWFGGKSGSWTHFDTTGNILPSGAPLTGDGQGSVMQQEGGKLVETLPDGSVGKPLSKANIDVLNSQTSSPAGITVSDGSSIYDEATKTWKDSVTGKELKLDTAGQPIPFESGTTGYKGPFQKVKDAYGGFKETNKDAISGMQTGLTMVDAYNTFAGQDEQVVGSNTSSLIDGMSQLSYSQDQGGIVNTTAPIWDMSYMTNATSAANAWNSNYGFGSGFDPNQTPGYGYTWAEWMRTQGGSFAS